MFLNPSYGSAAPQYYVLPLHRISHITALACRHFLRSMMSRWWCTVKRVWSAILPATSEDSFEFTGLLGPLELQPHQALAGIRDPLLQLHTVVEIF